MSKMLENAKKELERAGYKISEGETEKEIKSDFDYANACAQNAYDMLKVFSKGGHSGFSAQVTLAIFNKLARWKALSPLTNDPNEWDDISDYESKPVGSHLQSKRQPSCFSDDCLKTYYDVDEEENYVTVEEIDGEGKVIESQVHKPKKEWVHHELKEKE